MPNLLQNLINGAGSVLELMPVQKSRFDPNLRLRTVEESIASDWKRVGQHLHRAMAASQTEKHADATRK